MESALPECHKNSQRLHADTASIGFLATSSAGRNLDRAASGACRVSVRTLYRWERGETRPRKAAVHVLDEMVRSARQPLREQPTFRFADVFAGIGGLRRGFEPLGGECVFTSEWDRYAQLTYKANYTCNHEVVGDIRKVPVAKFPNMTCYSRGSHVSRSRLLEFPRRMLKPAPRVPV